MEAIAVLVGKFIGAVLAQCGPVIVEILQSAFKPTAEDSKAPDALRNRLNDIVRRMFPDASKDGLRKAGDPGTPSGDAEKR